MVGPNAAGVQDARISTRGRQKAITVSGGRNPDCRQCPPEAHMATPAVKTLVNPAFPANISQKTRCAAVRIITISRNHDGSQAGRSSCSLAAPERTVSLIASMSALNLGAGETSSVSSSSSKPSRTQAASIALSDSSKIESASDSPKANSNASRRTLPWQRSSRQQSQISLAPLKG